jgi:hypothetical protein
MKRTLISALFVSASLAAAPVFAQGSTDQATQDASHTLVLASSDVSVNGGLTRAEVKRELAAAREAGLVPSNEFNYPYDYNSLSASQRAALGRVNPNSASSGQD